MICIKCHLDKEIEAFCLRSKLTGVRSKSCKLCVNAYNKQHYSNNKLSYKKKARKWFHAFLEERMKLLLQLKSKPCTDCGNSFPSYVMDFDHLPGTIKRANISILVRREVDDKLFLEEVAKCELVCANCHRIRTFTRK